MTAGWAFVDVETTGLNPSWDRVVSVSVLAFDGAGRFEGELHSLVNPGRDPGPVHIHGLTAEMLASAPAFSPLAPQIRDLLHGRVLVAHNAQFDYKFLHAETARASVELTTAQRLCTLALARRLDLPVVDHKLSTVAAYWGVPQYAPHSSRDDVRVLREVFLHCQAFAGRVGVGLPVMSCTGRGAIVYPARVTRVPSPYLNPKTWTPPARLVQGMKVVITGPTSRAREDLAKAMSDGGLDVMNAFSGQTRLVVCNETQHASIKHDKARASGIPVMTETEVVSLLVDVEPGVRRGAPHPAGADRTQTGVSSTTGSRPAASSVITTGGPWTGRSVLVLGGTAQQAADARAAAGALGARILVNLGARTTHALLLDGAGNDRRYLKIQERAIPTLTAADLVLGVPGAHESQATGTDTEAGIVDGTGATGVLDEAVVLGRGHVIDLPPDGLRYNMSASWQPEPRAWGTNDEPGFEVDVVAFALRADGLVDAEEDFVFYNQPSTPDGGLRLTMDGTCEQGLDLDLDALGDDTMRVRVAAAIDGEATFGDVGAIRLSLTDAETGIELASATMDAATEERSLVLAEVYRRGSSWRFRAVGQGFTTALEDLVTSHGIAVE